MRKQTGDRHIANLAKWRPPERRSGPKSAKLGPPKSFHTKICELASPTHLISKVRPKSSKSDIVLCIR